MRWSRVSGGWMELSEVESSVAASGVGEDVGIPGLGSFDGVVGVGSGPREGGYTNPQAMVECSPDGESYSNIGQLHLPCHRNRSADRDARVEWTLSWVLHARRGGPG